MSQERGYMPKSKSDTHITPDRVYEMIEDRWGYTKHEMWDPCPVNGTGGLEKPWLAINYVNPPYSNLKEWVQKAIEETVNGAHTIMLLPSKTEQQWFHDLIDRNYEIVWIRRRLKFKNNKDTATQPHFLVYVK